MVNELDLNKWPYKQLPKGYKYVSMKDYKKALNKFFKQLKDEYKTRNI